MGGRVETQRRPAPAPPRPARAAEKAPAAQTPDTIIKDLQSMRAMLSDVEFARLLRTNDPIYQFSLAPFGWHGSWVADADYLRDFDTVAANFRDAPAQGPLAQLAAPAALPASPQKPPPEPPAAATKTTDTKDAAAAHVPAAFKVGMPRDVIIDWEQQGSIFTLKQEIVRDGLHSMLVTTANASPFRIISQQLFRRDDGRNPDWTNVTREAERSGKLNIEWRMPDLRTDMERLKDIETPGLLYGLFPHHVGSYLKDQTLPIKNPYLRMQASAMQQTMRSVSVVNADLLVYVATSVAPEAIGAVRGLITASTGLKAAMGGGKAGLNIATQTASRAVRPVATQTTKAAKSAIAPTATEIAEAAATQLKRPAGSWLKRRAREFLASAKIGLSNADEIAMRTGSSGLQGTSQTVAKRAAAPARAAAETAPAVARPATRVTTAAAKPAATTAVAPAVSQATPAVGRAATAPARTATSIANTTAPTVGAVVTPATTAPATIVGSSRPAAGQALVGSSRAQMRSAAIRIILSIANHPLRFLLDASGKFHRQEGLTEHHNLADHPELVQMGHIGSDKLGETERLMLQGAWENQLNNVSIESPHIGGAVIHQEAISIGGIAVDKRTAQFWEDIGWLPPGTVNGAPRIAP